jgi:hypothetical protein
MRVEHHRGGCSGVAEVRGGGLRDWRTWVRAPAGITCSVGIIIGVVVVWVVRVVGWMMEVANRCCWPLVTAP